VECAHVDFESRTATVGCRGDCDRQALLAALQKKGYGAVIR